MRERKRETGLVIDKSMEKEIKKLDSLASRSEINEKGDRCLE